MMLTIVISPENAVRNVMIQDEDNQVVAVMNVRTQGADKAIERAMSFVEAASNAAALSEAQETIKALLLLLKERGVRALVSDALYPAVAA